MNPTSENKSSSSQSVIDLDNTRKALEEEAQAISDELTQPTIDNDGNKTKPMGVDTPLVDDEGYPRSDIDIYRARGLRKRLNEIRQDHKLIMRKIEAKLTSNNGNEKNVGASTSSSSSSASKDTMSEEEVKARLAPKPKPKFDKKTGKWVVCNWDGTVAGIENGHLRKFDKLDDEPSSSSTATLDDNVEQMNNVDQSRQQTLGLDDNPTVIANSLSSSCVISDNTDDNRKPFAKINEIDERSPSAKGGLKLHDAVIRIGSVNETNHRDLQAVAEVVYGAFQRNEAITFVILRQSIDGFQKLNLQVKPGVWEGNGVLGCRIVKP